MLVPRTFWPKGLTLKEVGDHLGPMSVAATRIYAKVDLAMLQSVAQPWPEGTSC